MTDMEQCVRYDDWQTIWDHDPIAQAEYENMTCFVYRLYDQMLKAIPKDVTVLKTFVETGEVSLENDIIFATIGILQNREIGRRIIRWIEAEPTD
jgi:hypothetical protein